MPKPKKSYGRAGYPADTEDILVTRRLMHWTALVFTSKETSLHNRSYESEVIAYLRQAIQEHENRSQHLYLENITWDVWFLETVVRTEMMFNPWGRAIWGQIPPKVNWQFAHAKLPAIFLPLQCLYCPQNLKFTNETYAKKVNQYDVKLFCSHDCEQGFSVIKNRFQRALDYTHNLPSVKDSSQLAERNHTQFGYYWEAYQSFVTCYIQEDRVYRPRLSLFKEYETSDKGLFENWLRDNSEISYGSFPLFSSQADDKRFTDLVNTKGQPCDAFGNLLGEEWASITELQKYFNPVSD